MKILIGTNNIANNATALHKGFKSLGFSSTLALVSNNYYYNVPEDYIDISDLNIKASSLPTNSQRQFLLKKNYKHLLLFDLYIFICSSSLLPGNADLEVLKDLNKLVIFYNTGSDQRFGLIAKSLYAQYGVMHPSELYGKHINYSDSIDVISLQNPYLDTLTRKLHSVRMAEYYADAFISLPSVATLNVKPFMSLTYVMELTEPVKIKKHNDIPSVVHAPTNTVFKQTSFILNTIFKLWSDGLKFKFSMLRNLPNGNLLQSLDECDILLDQITVGAPALLANEGLAKGCVVASCNTKDTIPTPQYDIPVIDINNENLYDKIKSLIVNKEMRVDYSNRALEYNELRLHEPQKIAHGLLESLEKSLRGEFDCYPTVFLDHYACLEGEVIPYYLKRMTKELVEKYGIFNKAHLDQIALFTGMEINPGKYWDTSLLTCRKWGWERKSLRDGNV